MSAATVTIEGKRFVILPESEYEQLRVGETVDAAGLPPLPKPLANGNYPAIECARSRRGTSSSQRGAGWACRKRS
jgi:hypothetical protein